MHLLVLSAFRHRPTCTARPWPTPVSMHLLVLSAFRLAAERAQDVRDLRLNAPFGAQCFPTYSMYSAPLPRLIVSMHLLVLSAFRLKSACEVWHANRCLNAPFGAQCFPTHTTSPNRIRRVLSQCTFWCSVLSDARR